jgi:hypothetical protein
MFFIMTDDSGSRLLDVQAFIQPEEFFNKSLYLLFSRDRTKEREHENILKRAFRLADLEPQRLVVEKGIMMLECDGYGQAMAYDQYLFDEGPVCTRFFLPATYHIAVGKVPFQAARERLNERVYVFRQDRTNRTD